MGLNLSMARHSPAVVMASSTFSKLDENTKYISNKHWKAKYEGGYLIEENGYVVFTNPYIVSNMMKKCLLYAC